MQLIYKINYHSTSGYFKNIITDLIDTFGLKATCKQYKTFITIHCDDKESKIESFFASLEQNLPLSLFLKSAELVDFIDDKLESLEEKTQLQNIAIKPSEIIDIYNNSTEYTQEVQQIKAGNIVSFETSNGIKDICLPNEQNRIQLNNDVRVLVVNLNALKDLFAINQKDIQLLSCIERPLVKLKFNILKNAKKEYSSTNFVDVKLPSDQAEYALATALRKEGIDFVIYGENAVQEDLKVTYTDEQNLIISGDRAIFPKYDYTLNKEYKSSKEYFEQNGGVYKAILSQFNKRLENSMGVYLSLKSDESCIAVNIPSKGITPIIQVPNVMTDFDICMEEIESIDENTQRLLSNYKKKFPHVFQNSAQLENTNGFETIITLAAHMIGLNDAKAFEEKAFEFNAKSGINVDFIVTKIDGINYLDYRRIVQSIMSYKMAGVENNMLAFSFYESLSEFISDNVQKIKSELGTNDVVLCGDLFANTTLLSKTQKALSAYNVLLPKEYPLDIY